MTSIGHQCKNTLHLSYVKILNQLLYNIHAILWSVCVKCLRIDGHCIRCVWRKFWYSLSSFWIATKMHFDKNRIGRIFLVVKWVFFILPNRNIFVQTTKNVYFKPNVAIMLWFYNENRFIKIKEFVKNRKIVLPLSRMYIHPYNNTHLIF